MAHKQFSPRDEYYLNATRFESYMLIGGVFLFGFTMFFILGVLLNAAWLVWPGMFLSIAVAYYVLRILKKREYQQKLRELEADYRAREQLVGEG